MTKSKFFLGIVVLISLIVISLGVVSAVYIQDYQPNARVYTQCTVNGFFKPSVSFWSLGKFSCDGISGSNRYRWQQPWQSVYPLNPWDLCVRYSEEDNSWYLGVFLSEYSYTKFYFLGKVSNQTICSDNGILNGEVTITGCSSELEESMGYKCSDFCAGKPATITLGSGICSTKCPEEIPECQTCDDMGVIKNKPDGTSCKTSENKEGFCDQGECVFESPNIKVWLEPDFFEKYEGAEQVNYTNIFPPELNCTAYAEDSDSEDSDEIILNFSFSAKNTIGSIREIYNIPTSVMNKNNKTISLPQQYAELIYPEDEVICNVTLIDKDNNIGDSDFDSITMPSFDLFVNQIKAINVVEDVDLVVGKPFMARVWVFFTSDLITEMDKDADILANMPDGTHKTIEFKPLLIPIPEGIDPEDPEIEFIKSFAGYQTYIESVKDNIRLNPQNPDNKDMVVLRKIKNGDDSANFFQWIIPTSAGSIAIGALVDPDEKFNELNRENNLFSYKEFSVVETKEIKILPVSVVIYDQKEAGIFSGDIPPPKGVYYVGDSPENHLAKTAEVVKSQTEFLKKIYPLSPENVKLLESTILIVSKDFKVPMNDKDYRLDEEFNTEIFKKLNLLAKSKGADYAVGVVYDKTLSTDEGCKDGISKVGWLKKDWGGYLNAVILTGPSANEKIVEREVLAHEIGHLNGIKAGEWYWDYSDDKGGRAVSNGWLINQKNGNIEASRINIWAEPGEIIYSGYPFFLDEFRIGDTGYRETDVGGFYALDLLAKPKSVTHISKEQYIKLLNNYKK